MKNIFSQANSPSWEQAPEIIAISASNKDALKKPLFDLKEQLHGEPAMLEEGTMAEKNRNSFQAKRPCRLLIVIEPNEMADQVINAAIKGLYSHPE
jgi:hypothetical protein